VKKVLIMLTILLALVTALAACTPETVVLPENDKKIDEVQGIAAREVVCIERHDESTPPGQPSFVWRWDKDIEAMIKWLKSIQLAEKVSEDSVTAPGTGYSYIIKKSDGSSVSIGLFSKGAVHVEDGWYTYTSEPLEMDDVALYIDGYDPETGEIKCVIRRWNGDGEYYIFGAPKLERMTEEGWQEINSKSTDSAKPSWLGWGNNEFGIYAEELETGDYRVSRTVVEGEVHLAGSEHRVYSDTMRID